MSEIVCLRSDSCYLEIFYGAQSIGGQVIENSYFSGFKFGTLDDLNKEPMSVLQDGSVSLKALGGNSVAAKQCVCVMGIERAKY